MTKLATAQHPPLIGITGRQARGVVIGAPPGFVDAPVDIYLREYARSVALAGGISVHIPLETDAAALVGRLDGLIIAGGEDVDPQRYGQERGPFVHVVDPVRDALEVALLEAATARGIPVVGICRGQQLINVAHGGTLIQDLASVDRGSHMGTVEPRAELVHDVRLVPDTVTHGLYGDRIRVNTFHHQAVDRLGAGLIVAGTAPDGTIEAIESASSPIVAVQWHPECFDGDPIFEWLIREARTRLTAAAPQTTAIALMLSASAHLEQELTHVTAP